MNFTHVAVHRRFFGCCCGRVSDDATYKFDHRFVLMGPMLEDGIDGPIAVPQDTDPKSSDGWPSFI